MIVYYYSIIPFLLFSYSFYLISYKKNPKKIYFFINFLFYFSITILSVGFMLSPVFELGLFISSLIVFLFLLAFVRESHIEIGFPKKSEPSPIFCNKDDIECIKKANK